MANAEMNRPLGSNTAKNTPTKIVFITSVYLSASVHSVPDQRELSSTWDWAKKPERKMIRRKTR
jgi:hypothetical protein